MGTSHGPVGGVGFVRSLSPKALGKSHKGIPWIDLSLKELVLKKKDGGMTLARGSLMLWEPKVSKAKTKQAKPACRRVSLSYLPCFLHPLFSILLVSRVYSCPAGGIFIVSLSLRPYGRGVQMMSPQNPCTQKNWATAHHPACSECYTVSQTKIIHSSARLYFCSGLELAARVGQWGDALPRGWI